MKYLYDYAKNIKKGDRILLRWGCFADVEKVKKASFIIFIDYKIAGGGRDSSTMSPHEKVDIFREVER